MSEADDDLADAREQKRDDEDALEEAEQSGNQSEITRLKSAIATDETAIEQAEVVTHPGAAEPGQHTAEEPAGGRNPTRSGPLGRGPARHAQQAQVAANQQQARQGAVDSAQAQIDSAEVTVREARTVIDDTVLRAPRAGTIATIGAVVGQSSSAAGSAESGT